MAGLLLAVLAGPAVRAAAPPADPSVNRKLEGTESIFTPLILQLAQTWPQGRDFCHFEKKPLQIQTERIPTEGRPYYVGFKKCMSIHAPLAAVARVLDDVDHYQQLFPGDKEVRVVERNGNLSTLAWKRKIPVFFVPDVEYQISYLSSSPSPGIRMYRSQLKRGDRLHFSDALVVLETTGPDTTFYSDYEFYEADYGLGVFGIHALSSDSVWRESLEGSYLSLLSIRLKAEHPDWDYPRIAEEREQALRSLTPDKNRS
jgi:hypothetical protein